MTEKELLVVVPTRERPHKITELIEAWRATTSGNSELLICLDDDDAENYTIPDDVSLMTHARMRLGPWLNYATTSYKSENPIKYIGFMGDDHRPRTKNWDQLIIEPLESRLGVSYGNDLLQGEALATAAFMNKEIVDKLGYFCTPGCIHLYLDNFWMTLGNGLQSLHYRPDVIIEHEHFSIGKSEKDALYEEVNSSEMYRHDEEKFNEYLKNQYRDDLKKLQP